MDTGERLAAYLAGDLDAEEAAALEADLDRDPALRARLERIRDTDRALAELPDAEPRPGFSEELRATVDQELATRLGDELAARRRGRMRSIPAWAAPAAAAAAAVAIVAGIVVTGQGGDDAARPTDGEVQREALDEAGQAEAARVDGPTITASERRYDQEAVSDLTADPRFGDVLSRDLDEPEGAALARRYAEQLGVALASPVGDAAASAQTEEDLEAADEPAPDEPAPDEPAPEEPADDDGAAQTAPAPAPTDLPVTAFQQGEVTAEDRAAVRRCLPELLESAETPVVPAFAETAVYDGQEAIIYGLVGRDPDAGTVTRPEVWVVDRDDCLTLFFAQGSQASR